MPQDPFAEAAKSFSVSQALLIEFLSTDLDLAFTFLDLAQMYIQSDPDHFRGLMQKARRVLETVRKFEERIQDPRARQATRERGDSLEAAMAAAQS
jgi:hypothetical protein